MDFHGSIALTWATFISISTTILYFIFYSKLVKRYHIIHKAHIFNFHKIMLNLLIKKSTLLYLFRVNLARYKMLTYERYYKNEPFRTDLKCFD